MKINNYLKEIAFFVNVVSIFLLLQGVGKIETTLLIILIALVNYLQGVQEGLKKR